MPRHLLLLAAMLLALLLTPASALAHASLVSSSPADKEQLDAAPSKVELEFSGTVVAGAGSIQVFDPDGRPVQSGKPSPEKGARVTQAIDAEEHGTYAIAYRVSSEDGHVITGTTTFVVVKASHGGGAATKASEDAAKVDRTLQVAFSLTRFVEVLSLLIAAGGGIFACLLAPGWRPRLVVGAVATLLISYGLGFVLNAAIVGGTSFGGALSSDALSATSDTPFALSLMIRGMVAIVAIAPALLLAYGPPLGPTARAATAVVFVGLAASLSITGHAVTTDPMALRMPLDMIHVTAAAIWIGGLVQLAYMAPFAAAHVEAIDRFSRTAFASVVVLLLTGIYATLVELDMHLGELLHSEYGRLVVAKLVLYLGTMPLAWNNMSAFVPQVRRRPEDAPRMLRQYVLREFALLLLVLAFTVWLIATPQPK
jgi:copper transport protein